MVVETDSRGRLSVGRLGLKPGQRYEVWIDRLGVITLKPVVDIDSRRIATEE